MACQPLADNQRALYLPENLRNLRSCRMSLRSQGPRFSSRAGDIAFATARRQKKAEEAAQHKIEARTDGHQSKTFAGLPPPTARELSLGSEGACSSRSSPGADDGGIGKLLGFTTYLEYTHTQTN